MSLAPWLIASSPMLPDLIPFATIIASAGILLLRLAWGRQARSAALTGFAWALLLAAVIAGTWQAGAWGTAMVALAAMTTATGVLAFAAVTAPAGKPMRLNPRRIADVPRASSIGQKLLTLLLAGILPMAAALFVALALRVLADLLGWSQANSNVLCLLMMPIVWAGMTFWLLMMRRPVQRVVLLAGTIVSGAAIIWMGGMA